MRIPIKEILNTKYGKLVPIREIKLPMGQRRIILCKCSCGTIKKFSLDALRNKKRPTRSCGCLSKEIWRKMLSGHSQRYKGTGNPNYQHGDNKTRFHMLFNGITCRCRVKSSSSFFHYGAKGIKCEWENYIDFKKDMYRSYLKHVKKYGEKQTTIDRINPFGNYNKSNCRWATWKEQRHNRRSS